MHTMVKNCLPCAPGCLSTDTGFDKIWLASRWRFCVCIKFNERKRDNEAPFLDSFVVLVYSERWG